MAAGSSSTTTPAPQGQHHRWPGERARRPSPQRFSPHPTASALDFNTVVSSGLSVGVPGTLALWDTAAKRFGTRSLARLLAPGERVARDGFPVDATFAQQTADNAARFQKFPATAALFLPGGAPPAVGSTFRNPDLAATYDTLRHKGVGWFYQGGLGADIVDAARNPSTAPGRRRLLRPGDAQRPPALPGRRAGAHAHGVPGSGCLRHGAAQLGRASDRRGTEPAGGLRPADRHVPVAGEQCAVPAPVLRGQRHRVRRPQPVDRRRAGRARERSAARQGFADERACQLFSATTAQPRPIAWGSARRAVRRLRPGQQQAAGCARRPRHDAPGRGRQVGQRRELHPDHRADRRLRASRCPVAGSCSTTR